MCLGSTNLLTDFVQLSHAIFDERSFFVALAFTAEQHVCFRPCASGIDEFVFHRVEKYDHVVSVFSQGFELLE